MSCPNISSAAYTYLFHVRYGTVPVSILRRIEGSGFYDNFQLQRLQILQQSNTCNMVAVLHEYNGICCITAIQFDMFENITEINLLKTKDIMYYPPY